MFNLYSSSDRRYERDMAEMSRCLSEWGKQTKDPMKYSLVYLRSVFGKEGGGKIYWAYRTHRMSDAQVKLIVDKMDEGRPNLDDIKKAVAEYERNLKEK